MFGLEYMHLAIIFSVAVIGVAILVFAATNWREFAGGFKKGVEASKEKDLEETHHKLMAERIALKKKLKAAQQEREEFAKPKKGA